MSRCICVGSHQNSEGLGLEQNNRSNIVLWSCAAAAVGGIIAIVAVTQWRRYAITATSERQTLRDVKDVIAECYHKIDAIESRLSSVVAP